MDIGIDLGGTKIEAIALGDDGDEVDRIRVPTPRGDYSGIVTSVAALVEQLEDRHGEARSIGVGSPGAIDRSSGMVKNANSVALNGRPLGEDLRDRLGGRVVVANDADCFALSEARDGAGAGTDPVFGVILGTGVGGGVVVGGALVAGVNGVAGEWGHLPLQWPRPSELPGPPCYCGRFGCVETYLSGPGLERDHAAASGTRLPAREIAAAAEAGDEMARASLERYADRLARSLAAVINVVDPETIVLGGGVSNIPYWYERVPELWTRYVFSDAVVTRIAPAAHGDSSGVRGAAWLGRSLG